MPDIDVAIDRVVHALIAPLPDAAALMTKIAASDLRDRVSLEKQEQVDDGYGGVAGQWVFLAVPVPVRAPP